MFSLGDTQEESQVIGFWQARPHKKIQQFLLRAQHPDASPHPIYDAGSVAGSSNPMTPLETPSMTHNLNISTGLTWNDLQFRRRRTRLPHRMRAWANRCSSHEHSFRALRRYLKRYGKPSRLRWTLSRCVFSSNNQKVADELKHANVIFAGTVEKKAGGGSGESTGGGAVFPTTAQILADWEKPQSLSPQEQDNVNQALSTWLKFISDDTPRSDSEVIQFTLNLCSGWKPALRLELDRLMRCHAARVAQSREVS